MTGYFTQLKFVLRARSFGHLEDLVGYRSGRLAAKGVLVYQFVRLPEVDEFEVRGTSIVPKEKWDREYAPRREADLAAAAKYHQNTRVPTFDQIQRRNARAAMSLSGGNALVKLYPVDYQPIDDTPDGYPHGLGIPQWRLTDAVSRSGAIHGRLLHRADPGCPLPWLVAPPPQ